MAWLFECHDGRESTMSIGASFLVVELTISMANTSEDPQVTGFTMSRVDKGDNEWRFASTACKKGRP